MSLIKTYKCDVCDKQQDKYDLYRFKVKEKTYLDEMYTKDTVENFDICKRCYKKIVKQIRKECD